MSLINGERLHGFQLVKVSVKVSIEKSFPSNCSKRLCNWMYNKLVKKPIRGIDICAKSLICDHPISIRLSIIQNW